jgi:hypothetical protein
MFSCTLDKGIFRLISEGQIKVIFWSKFCFLKQILRTYFRIKYLKTKKMSLVSTNVKYMAFIG